MVIATGGSISFLMRIAEGQIAITGPVALVLGFEILSPQKVLDY